MCFGVKVTDYGRANNRVTDFACVIRRNQKVLNKDMAHVVAHYDSWIVRTIFFCDCQVISVKKLRLVSRLHVIEQSWVKTAEHCSLFLTLKVTKQLLFLNTFCTAHRKKHQTLFGLTFLEISLVVQSHSDNDSDLPAVGHRGPEYHRGAF